jgi:hypothetical protein
MVLMKETTKRFFAEEWAIIKKWGLPVLGMTLGALAPVVGFWMALVAYIFCYPMWKAEPESHHNLKVFATLGLVLSFIAMMALIYLLATGILEESSINLIAHIVKD